jgi:hypothetical protein
MQRKIENGVMVALVLLGSALFGGLMIAGSGCGTAEAGDADLDGCPDPQVVVVLEYNDLGEPCIEGGLPSELAACCPSGFAAVGIHGAAVVCLGS